MNHGGIGYIDRRSLQLSPDLLKPLAVDENTRLFGMYYTRKGRRYPHDFMITPVPPRAWSKIGRIIVRLKHEAGTLGNISNILKDENVNIITAECNRSGHRYATWVLTVCFENISEGDFDTNESTYTGTESALDKLSEDLRQRGKKYLFTDDSDKKLRNPVIPMHNCALAYFRNRLDINLKNEEDMEWLYEPFHLDLQSGHLIGNHVRLGQIYDYIQEKDKLNDEEYFPSVLFSEMDTWDVNTRNVIIPQKSLERFFTTEVVYERTTKPDSTRGLLAFITENIPERYNMWRVFNQTHINEPDTEIGRIYCIFEDEEKDAKDVIGTAKGLLKFHDIKRRKAPKGLKHIEIFEPRIRPIKSKEIQRMINKEHSQKDAPKDIFVSYSSKDKTDFENLVDRLRSAGISFYHDTDLKTGDIVGDEIRNFIERAREFCILFTPNVIDSKWVTKELTAAWALKKRRTAIVHGMQIKDLPEELKDIHHVTFADIDKYLLEIAERRPITSPLIHPRINLNLTDTMF
jgi:hypothetical protein